MDEHSSIFYIRPLNYYVLCTDSDLEQLISRRRRNYLRFIYHLYGDGMDAFHTVYVKGGNMVMRVIYNPVKTEQLRRPDGYVDRCVEVDREWLKQRKMAFDLAFPSGLPFQMLKRYKKPELDC